MLNSKTLHEVLFYSLTHFSDNPFMAFVGDKPITFAQFGTEVKKLQEKLINCGVTYQDKVAILGENSPSWAIAYFAIVDMGAIAVPLLADFTKDEARTCINHSDAKLLFVSKRMEEKIDKDNYEHIQTIISLDTFSEISSSPIKENEKGNYTIPKPEDLASIIYTSGTTGFSKGVMLTHQNLTAQLVQIHNIWNITEKDVYLSVLPLSHTFENSLGLLTATMKGATIFYHNKLPVSKTFMESVAIVRPTTILAVPLLMEKAYKNVIKPKLENSFIKRILLTSPLFKRIMYRIAAKKLYASFGGRLTFFGIGGAKLDGETELFLRLGKHFPYAIGYGLTETAPLIIGANPHQVSWQTTGFPIKDVQLKIVDVNPQTGEGELLVKAPNVMKGYYKNPELTKEVFTEDGWFKTGDLVCEKKGRYEIKGRKKNVILGSSGENIYPEEIEMVLNQHNLVLESVVIERNGKLVAMVQFNPEELQNRMAHIKENTAQAYENIKTELLKAVNIKLNKFSKLSLIVEYSKEFEKTATLKIKRYMYK
ncbi:MAG: AMP-binding protein [Bacteroidales bacterium]|jgi:long-chain acyl-CoA synthetase|nr:AMP-binding protein [Bacteroidales bacterium]